MLALAISLFCTVAALIFAMVFQIKRKYEYWERRGVKGPKPIPLIGNFLSIYKRLDSINSLVDKYYNEYSDEKIVGIYQGLRPIMIIRDPEIIQQVTIKDFSSFVNRGLKLTNETLSHNLFAEDGDDWRVLRHNFSPLFTSGKLKKMMPLLNDSVKGFVTYTRESIKDQSCLEMKNLSAKYSLKGITSCAFGIDVNTFNEDQNILTEMSTKVLTPNFKIVVFALIDSLLPGVTKNIPVELMDKDIKKFFINMTDQIIKEREGKPKLRQDFMDLLIEMKEKGIVGKRQHSDNIAELEITNELLVAQAFIFYLGGFETSSGTISFLLYELALNPDIQERCYEEILKIMKKYDGELSFDSLNEFTYVTMVFEETLRKYPLVGVILREAVENYTFSGTKLSIDEQTKIFIPVPSIHNDPKYYPNPEKFDPERFSPKNRDKIHSSIYMPFGEGPRNCIGMRFGKVSSLLAVIHFLYNFQVEKCEKTSTKIIYDPASLVLCNTGGIWLDIKSRR